MFPRIQEDDVSDILRVMSPLVMRLVLASQTSIITQSRSFDDWKEVLLQHHLRIPCSASPKIMSVTVEDTRVSPSTAALTHFFSEHLKSFSPILS